MARFSVYLETTDISDFVTECPPVPLVKTTHDGVITLGSMSLTVIDNAVSYAKDQVVSFKEGGNCFAKFIIDEVAENYEANTKTLSLVDALKLLEKYYAKDMVAADFEAAMTTTALDWYLGTNTRYYWGASSTPHEVRFVGLTHYIKAALIKAGLAADGYGCDASDLYGLVESGFVRWDPDTDAEVAIYCDHLCFHPDQIMHAGMFNAKLSEYAAWEGATLLDVVRVALYAMNAVLRYSGSIIELRKREVFDTVADDDVYSYSASTWLNAFDTVTLKERYYLTVFVLAGFGDYVNETYGSAYVGTGQWTYPTTGLPTGRQLASKTITLPHHAIVHYRERLSSTGGAPYYCYNMHKTAYELGDPGYNAYTFVTQFAKLLFGRFPVGGNVEKYELPADVEALGPRHLLSLEVDVVNEKTMLEC